MLQCRTSRDEDAKTVAMSSASRMHRRSTDQAAATRPGQAQVAYVVDDDPAALSILCEIVEGAGWEPRAFERLGALRNALASQPPDLVILDDDLPDGRGGDEARTLRQRPGTRRLPILFCTAAPPARRREISHFASVLPKPFDVEHLDRWLHQVRRDRRMSSAGA